MSKWFYEYRRTIVPPSFGQEIETCIDGSSTDIQKLDDLGFLYGWDGSGPFEIRLPPIKIPEEYDKLCDALKDLATVLGPRYPEVYIDDDGREQLGCHVHVRPTNYVDYPPEHPLISYQWAKFAVIVLNLIPWLKPLVCWFKSENRYRCRNSFRRWASMSIYMDLPRGSLWQNRHEIYFVWHRSNEYAVTPSIHRTLEIRAFETISINAWAFVIVALTIHNNYRLCYGRKAIHDSENYLMNWTSHSDVDQCAKLVLRDRQTEEKIVLEKLSPKMFYEWLRQHLWEKLPYEARKVLEVNFEQEKISTFEDAERYSLI